MKFNISQMCVGQFTLFSHEMRRDFGKWTLQLFNTMNVYPHVYRKQKKITHH